MAQFSEIIIHHDGHKQYVFRRDPNGRKHSHELQEAMGPDQCWICDRLFSAHTWQEFDDHLDQLREQARKRTAAPTPRPE